MKIDVLTLFPEMFRPVLAESIIKRAQEKKLVNIKVHNLRDWATDKHKRVDDKAYGGGAGMILKADVVDQAFFELKGKQSLIILTTPKGKRFNQSMAIDLTKGAHLILLCGHYGGYDQRIHDLVDMEVSMGDFILTGGEIPAMAIIDAVTRLVPDVINSESLKNETHTKRGYKQYPQYTNPREFIPKSKSLGKLEVPEVLLSGNHAEIEKWRLGK